MDFRPRNLVGATAATIAIIEASKAILGCFDGPEPNV